MWHVYPVMGCRCTNMHMKNMKNWITLQFQPAVVDVEQEMGQRSKGAVCGCNLIQKPLEDGCPSTHTVAVAG